MSIPNDIIQYKSFFNFKDISDNPYVFFRSVNFFK